VDICRDYQEVNRSDAYLRLNLRTKSGTTCNHAYCRVFHSALKARDMPRRPAGYFMLEYRQAAKVAAMAIIRRQVDSAEARGTCGAKRSRCIKPHSRQTGPRKRINA